MYGPVCSPSRGTPPVFFLILGVHRRADGRALGSFRLCPGRQYAMEGPCAAMQIVRRTEDLEFGGLVPVCSQYARGAARGHACRFSGGLFSWAVGRGRVLPEYTLQSRYLARDGRGLAFTLHWICARAATHAHGTRGRARKAPLRATDKAWVSGRAAFLAQQPSASHA